MKSDHPRSHNDLQNNMDGELKLHNAPITLVNITQIGLICLNGKRNEFVIQEITGQMLIDRSPSY